MNVERYKKDIESLIGLGEKMKNEFATAISKEKEESSTLKFFNNYQDWYTEAHAIIQQLLSSRVAEFEALYFSDPKRKKMDNITYSIQDWLLGVRSAINDFTGKKNFHDAGVIVMKFQTQLSILKTVRKRLRSSLFEIKQLLQADIFDNELDAAEELLKKGFVRASGAVAGVVLESHLETVCGNHDIRITKKRSTIADYNDLLKKSNVLDTKDWRRIQFLGDIRNLCDHKKKAEPKKEELEDLIGGVKKVMKNIF